MNNEHHPSCTENDKSLVQHCNQCGLNEPCDEMETELERLRAELPEMRKENRRLTAFLQDAAAFIRTGGADRTWDDKVILTTLIHDITGLANDEPCFQPRVSGYSARERAHKIV